MVTEMRRDQEGVIPTFVSSSKSSGLLSAAKPCDVGAQRPRATLKAAEGGGQELQHEENWGRGPHLISLWKTVPVF